MGGNYLNKIVAHFITFFEATQPPSNNINLKLDEVYFNIL